MLHPVHYSLILNLAILVIAGLLAWVFVQPLVFIVALIGLQHMVGRFPPDDADPEQDNSGGGIGFMADIE
jgi:hypothetical protein